jgi:hypothetical protein
MVVNQGVLLSLRSMQRRALLMRLIGNVLAWFSCTQLLAQ